MADRQRLRAALAEHSNVRAFLRAIRLGEGTSDDRGYHRIVGGQEFEDFSHHPGVKVFLPRYGVRSSAAGAYQFIWPTWNGLVAEYGFEDFAPERQDQGAVALILEHHALDEVEAGKVVEAIRLCSPVWASLPGSLAGQRTEALDRVVAEYVKWGGQVAA
jgi:muramidase (phage lysozyme)